jgi:hypothetical protein
VAPRKKLAVSAGFEGGLEILDTEDPDVARSIRAEVASLDTAGGLSPNPLITGDDLIRLGMSPGPVFKRVLEVIYDAQLEGRVEDRAAALAMAREVAAKAGPGPAGTLPGHQRRIE